MLIAQNWYRKGGETLKMESWEIAIWWKYSQNDDKNSFRTRSYSENNIKEPLGQSISSFGLRMVNAQVRNQNNKADVPVSGR